MDYIVETIDLVRRFKKRKSYHELMHHPFRTEWFTALNKVNLQIKPGEVFGLLGPNGAGKTTLIKILCTLILPTSGQAFVRGYDVTRHGKEIRQIFGYVIAEERSFHWRLTARQNLNFFATLNNLAPKQIENRVEEVLDLVGLANRADEPFYSFSTGMKQRLAIARGLLTDPDIVFMDEPTRSLDPPAAQVLRQFIKEKLVREQGKTVFIATHVMEEVEYLCDRVAILNKGKVLAYGSLSQIRQAISKRQIYSLGLYKVPEGLISKLGQLNGVVDIEPIASPSKQTQSYFQIEVQENGRAIVPDIITTVVQEGGQVSACIPIQEPLGETLSRILVGGE